MHVKTKAEIAKAKASVRFPYPQPTDPEQRIANGFTLLNYLVGEGWPLLINLETFDINNGSLCVLGQVFDPKLVGHTDTDWKHDNGYDNFLDDPDLATNLNGFVEGLLFDEDWDRYSLAQTIGMDSGSVGTPMWKEAIKEAQDKLGGEPAVRAAQELLARQRRGERQNA
jgi:hypothetical protein